VGYPFVRTRNHPSVSSILITSLYFIALRPRV
jgi:hypothetical protein